MTHTTVKGAQESAGSTFIRTVTMTVTSYTTGGEVADLVADLGVNSSLQDLRVSSRNGYIVAWDGSVTAPKIKVFSATTTEVAGATNVGEIGILVRYK